MKILILTKYSQIGASSRLRCFQYVPYLEQQGIVVTVQTLFDDDYLNRLYTTGRRSVLKIAMLYLRRLVVLFGVFRYDLIWIEKELFPYMPAAAEILLRFFDKPFVVDYDDAIFHNYDRSPYFAIRKLLSRKIESVMLQARYVVVGNEYLAERAKVAGARYIALIPTVVDHIRYKAGGKTVNAKNVIGWIGSPITQQYVVDIRDVLAETCRIKGARLLLVGANQDVVENLPGIDVEVVSWSEDSEAELISQMDIGIMPLPDGPWENGKCGYKLIQYMACGVPVIASSVGVNVKIVTHSQCGLLADTHAEWREGLCQLLESSELRSELGAAGRQAVTDIYCLAVQAPTLLQIFHEAFSWDKS